MNRRTKIHFPVFGATVRVIVSRDITRTAARLGGNLQDADAGFIYSGATCMVGHLVFKHDADVDTIAHEASHAVREIFRVVGVRADNEAFAYHLGYLVGRIHKFLKGRG